MKSSSLIQLTTLEYETLLAHLDPPDLLDAIAPPSATDGPLVELVLNDKALTIFLEVLEGTANSAQNIEAMNQLGAVFERITEGLEGRTDPGVHLLRPAAARYNFTPLQGRYLAFIATYQKLHGTAPAELDLQRYFGTSAPTVHAMIVTLHRRRLIARTPGLARSLMVLLPPEAIPAL